LPEKYRAPIVLCDLQGRTHKEAARELGWPLGTLSGRLWRARALLARRLTRRGLALTATVLMLAHSEDTAFANLATPLIQATMKAARMVMEGGTAAASGVSASVAALTQGVLKAMWMTKVRIAAALLLTASLGMGVFQYAARTQAQPRGEEKIFLPPADSAPVAIADKPPEKSDDPAPNVRDLIRYLNDNAHRVEGLRCSVSIDCRQDRQTVGLAGMIACQKPRHVHLQAKVLGQPAIVLGCNDEGYWCMFRFAEPPTLWRGRRDEEGRSGPQHWQDPYRPEWLLDVLGIATYDPKKPYSLRATNKHLELSETVHSPQGQPLRKVIVFHRLQQREGSQIAAILLKDADEKVLCRADIKKVYTDKETGARLTQAVDFSWPDDRLKASLNFHDFHLETFSSEQAVKLFASPWPKGRSFSGEQTQAPSAPVIQIDLTKEHMQARCREDVLKLSGQPNDPLVLRVLQGLLRLWAKQEKQAAVCITSSADTEYATVKAVLDACHEVGIRKIELRTPRRD
jgi:hypothetical protein